jgi:MtN3 and saliva related transmembrane protein
LELAQILGWIATILFSIMLVPQIIKTIRTKDTSGVSLLLFIIYLIANIFALIYAFMIYQSPLILKYSIAIATAVFYISLFLYYLNKKRKKGLSIK